MAAKSTTKTSDTGPANSRGKEFVSSRESIPSWAPHQSWMATPTAKIQGDLSLSQHPLLFNNAMGLYLKRSPSSKSNKLWFMLQRFSMTTERRRTLLHRMGQNRTQLSAGHEKGHFWTMGSMPGQLGHQTSQSIIKRRCDSSECDPKMCQLSYWPKLKQTFVHIRQISQQGMPDLPTKEVIPIQFCTKWWLLQWVIERDFSGINICFKASLKDLVSSYQTSANSRCNLQVIP